MRATPTPQSLSLPEFERDSGISHASSESLVWGSSPTSTSCEPESARIPSRRRSTRAAACHHRRTERPVGVLSTLDIAGALAWARRSEPS
jgi:hypothetical protein